MMSGRVRLTATFVQKFGGKEKSYINEPEPECPPRRAVGFPKAGADQTKAIAFQQEVLFPSETNGPTTVRCSHNRWELYMRSCLRCDKLCNCNYSYNPASYPDVLVRSVDKKIVRLSKELVRSSITLSDMVNDVLGKKRSSSKRAKQLVEEDVIIKTECNVSSAIMGYTKVTEDMSSMNVAPPSPKGKLTPAQALFEAVRKANQDTLADLIDVSGQDKLLVLFDEDSEEPTLGISQEVLMKLNQYICMHLDQVDRRVDGQRRCEEYFKRSGYCKRRHRELDDSDSMNVLNSFAYEDWEEEFFNIGTGPFFALHQANQELLIWDLYYALEKWILLGRGFPFRMKNGTYDYLNDPDFDEADTRNNFGLFNVGYHNPKRRSRHRQSRFTNQSDFNRVGFKPRWWSINTPRSRADDTVEV